MKDTRSDERVRAGIAAPPAASPETMPLPDRSTSLPAVRRFRLTILAGADAKTWESSGSECQIGSHALNNVCLEDPTVSRFHCEIVIEGNVARVRDLDSRNGTVLDGVRVRDAFLRSGSVLTVGKISLRFDLAGEGPPAPVSARSTFGSLVGSSIAMRQCFARMERAAASAATVLFIGETGTGKSRAAQAIHEASSRPDGPFVIVDCGAIPSNLLESELFGHERGAFTGAVSRRIGAFEEAHGGTVFLDEIGELPAELQPKLLRVIEERTIRRVGSNALVPVDVRVIAATHRDLRCDVNTKKFRSDLYYRLAVVTIALPALRQRLEDIPVIVERLIAALGAEASRAEFLRTPEFMAGLQHCAWPGNVRELRNHIERCLVFEDAAPPSGALEPTTPDARPAVRGDLPYAEARRLAIDAFESEYVRAVLHRNEGNITQAARAAEMDRVYLHRLLRRHARREDD